MTHPLGVSYLLFDFNEPLIVGATSDFTDGYVGCMTSLQLNGETLDLYDKVKNDPRYSYGLELGMIKGSFEIRAKILHIGLTLISVLQVIIPHSIHLQELSRIS